MDINREDRTRTTLPVLALWPLPAKVLGTAVVIMMGLGLIVAAGQATIHDILPTLLATPTGGPGMPEMQPLTPSPARGDLFSGPLEKTPPPPFYRTKDFLFALKFTHIHIFAMSGIFIVTGLLVIFLDLGAGLRAWLVALPFAGILIDLAAVWLKLYVDPLFFWLHMPGGMLFASVFAVDAVLILRQFWLSPAHFRP